MSVPLVTEPINRGKLPVVENKKANVSSKEDSKPKKSDWYTKLDAAIGQAKAGTFKIIGPDGKETGKTLSVGEDLAEGYPKIHCRFIKDRDFENDKPLTKQQRQASNYLKSTIKHEDKDYIRFPIYWEIELAEGIILSSDAEKTNKLREKMSKPDAEVYQIDSFVDQKDNTFIQTTVEQPKNPDQKPEESTYINGAAEDLNADRMALQLAKQYGNTLRFALGHGIDTNNSRSAFINWFARNNFIEIGLKDHKGNKITWANFGPEAQAFGPTRRYHEISGMCVSITDVNKNELEYELPHLKTAQKIQAKVGKAQFTPYLGKDEKISKSEYGKLTENRKARFEYEHYIKLLKQEFEQQRLEHFAHENRLASIILEQLDSYEKDRTANLNDAKYSHLSRAVGEAVANPEARSDDAIYNAINVAKLCNPALNLGRANFVNASKKAEAIAHYRAELKRKIESNNAEVKAAIPHLKNALMNYDVPFSADPVQKIEATKFKDSMAQNQEELDGLKELIGYKMDDVFARWHYLKCAMEGIDNTPAQLNQFYDRPVDPDYANTLPTKIGTGRFLVRALIEGLDETKVPVQDRLPIPAPMAFLGSNVAQGILYPLVKGLGSKVVKLLPGDARAWVAAKFSPDAAAVKKAFSATANPPAVAGEAAVPPPPPSQELQRLNFYDAYKEMIELQSQMFQLMTLANVIQNIYVPDKSVKLTMREFINTLPLSERVYQYHRMNDFNNEVEGIIQGARSKLEAEEKKELEDRRKKDFFVRDATATKKVVPPDANGKAKDKDKDEGEDLSLV